MGSWLFSVFVMTPFAAIQTALAAFVGYSVYMMGSGESFISGFFMTVLALLLLIGANKIVRLIRFGGDTWFGYLFLDILFAPLRLPLILLINLIAFIAIFTGWEIDAREEPDLDDYSFLGCVSIYLFHIVPGYRSNTSSASRSASTSQAYGSTERKRYKLRTVLYQFGVLLLTVLHSFVLLIVLGLVMESELGIGAQAGILIGMLILYFVAAIWSAALKGVTTTFSYWDPNEITEKTYRWDKDISDFRKVKEKKVNRAGWKEAITLPMLLYYIFGSVIVINQLGVFLLSIIVPANANRRACRASDADLSTFGKKLFYFFFGLSEV